MRHIRLYENFEDDLKSARDIFGLTSTFTKIFTDYLGTSRTIEFTGPSELEGEAKGIAEYLKKNQKTERKIQEELDSIGWQAVMTSPVRNSSYALKGPLANWNAALALIVKWDKDVVKYIEREENDHGGMSEEDLDSLYSYNLNELLESDQIRAKCAEIGYQVIEWP